MSQTIRSRILNYKKFVAELDFDQFIENKDTVKCHCSEYNTQFLNNERGNVLTGSLKIIKNNKLRKLFSKGPKYREPEQIDWGSARETVKTGIEDFIKNLSETKRVAVNYFQNWKFSLLELVDNKISKYSTKIKSRAVKSEFQDPDAKAELNRLRYHFVIVPIDKAAFIYLFIYLPLFVSSITLMCYFQN